MSSCAFRMFICTPFVKCVSQQSWRACPYSNYSSLPTGPSLCLALLFHLRVSRGQGRLERKHMSNPNVSRVCHARDCNRMRLLIDQSESCTKRVGVQYQRCAAPAHVAAPQRKEHSPAGRCRGGKRPAAAAGRLQTRLAGTWWRIKVLVVWFYNSSGSRS